ncbi:MAG: MerR family transcriptional regulator [Planctomycetes bacterium]|nr:MerR family transcriptional regulator [Planctomycetota bacterium]
MEKNKEGTKKLLTSTLLGIWSKQMNETMTKITIPKKLYRIGEIVTNTPFTRQTIHNYTVMGLIQESDWTKGGHRLYDESVFERLSLIMNLRNNKTLAQIRKILALEDNDSDDNARKATVAS